MKRFSVILVTLLMLLLLSSCESLDFGSGTFDFKNWRWNIIEKVDDKASEVSEAVESAAQESQKVVETINEKASTTIDNKIVAPIKEESKDVKESVSGIVEDAKTGTENIINEVSNWFEVKEETVKDTANSVKQNVTSGVNSAVSATKDVVETTSESLETAVSDVLSAMKDVSPKKDTVIVVPAKEETSTQKVETKAEETKTSQPQTATQIAKESLPAETVEGTGNSAVLIIILVAVGLIILAIAYYCISIKRKSY